ncbi:hypothetical protein LTR56_012993 [Elasticomyces elasticus]|nr:hypothetical protein LTR56_012993 [Elasticomyces elasticus]KAK3649277.1 hypothetical protein LTR22_013006 [Elasticomyces elasticus]KAK4928189.1 hypothetical protein LTR49_005127 [Elasticomyces elasticus]KAK5765943.1 hypothetical protein LTS12_003950 [Elasticomyces elasticus]
MSLSAIWNGHLDISDGEAIQDVTLSTTLPSLDSSLDGARLRYLAVVDVSRIPLHLAFGTHYHVTSSRPETESFFTRMLLTKHLQQTSPQWWESARPDSTLGILAAVDCEPVRDPRIEPAATEVLFYASKNEQPLDSNATELGPSPAIQAERTGCIEQPSFALRAVCLRSTSLIPNSEPSPPTSPDLAAHEPEGIFLPQLNSVLAEIINEPPVRKRKSVNDTFDEAAERRSKARRKGGEGVAAAAAMKTESNMPPLRHRRTVSISDSQILESQPRRLSRSPSVASFSAGIAGNAGELEKRSSLSRVQSISAVPTESVLEISNKAIISRMVMVGMRLRGLVQARKQQAQANSAELTSLPAVTAGSRGKEATKDDEYKLVYHQAFKSACFTYRRCIGGSSLQPFTSIVGETVDGLLDMFCSDPFEPGLIGAADKLTPGGRKAFVA